MLECLLSNGLVDAVGEFFAEASEEFVEGVGRFAALFGDGFDAAFAGVGGEEEFLVGLGELGEALAQGFHGLGLMIGVEGFGFVGEQFEDALAEDVAVSAELADGGKAFEADDDFSPGEEAGFVFELVEFFPEGEAGFLDDFVDEVPGGT